METKVTWKGSMAFSGLGPSGVAIPMDSSLEENGQNSGARPMELIAMGMAGCTGMDVISILRKKQQSVTAFEINVQADRAAEHPRKFIKIGIEYVVTGHAVDPAAVQRAVELSETKYCSAMATLRPGVPIESKITILEAK